MAIEDDLEQKTRVSPSGKEPIMNRARKITALAVIIMAMSLPARADFIADQSRISISSPKVPGLDQAGWLGNRNDFLN